MALRIDATEIDETEKIILEINGGQRRLYVRGEGFKSSGFELEIVVLNTDGNAVDDLVRTQIDNDDVSEKSLSVTIEANDEERGGKKLKVATGYRTVVVKKKIGYKWEVGKCVDNNCFEFPHGIKLVRTE